MMRRKIIKLATNTLVVSLPSKWAKEHGIKKGDEIDITEYPNSLIITSGQTAQRRATLTLGSPRFAARQINMAYKRGYDELEVSYEDHKAYAEMLKELPNLIGFDVISSGKKQCTVKNIASGEIENLDSLMRRSFLTVLDMAEAAEQHAKDHSDSTAEHIALCEQNVDKLTDFCKRLLNKHGASDIARTTLLYSLLRDIERAGDQYSTMPEITVPKELLPALSGTRALLRMLYELFYQPDAAKADEFLEKLSLLGNNMKILLKNTRHAAAAHRIMTITELLGEMSWAVYAKGV
jgi:phosphate uptake regulator